MVAKNLCESRSDSSGLPYICSLAAGHKGAHEAHTDVEGTVAATWPKTVGLAGPGWTWAASLPTDLATITKLCEELRSALISGDDAVAVDEDVEWTLAEQAERWGTVRAFARLTAGQRRALVLASKLHASRRLMATGARVVNELTAKALAA